MRALLQLSKQEIQLIVAMALVVVASNVLVQFLVGNWLTIAAFTYPFAFLVTDITNRLLGARYARKIVAYGFVMGILCSVVGTQILNAEGFPYVTLQVAIASASAFFVSQMLDTYIFSRIKSVTWFVAPLVSSVIGGAVDTIIFFSLAFSPLLVFLGSVGDAQWAREVVPLLGFGVVTPLWISLAVADYFVKLVVSIVSLIPFRYYTKQNNQR